MANWQRHIRLQPEWGQAQDGEITVQELSAVIAKRLSALPPFIGDDENVEFEKEELVDAFLDMANDDSATERELDCWMEILYDWGDTHLDNKWNGKKVCWIDTISAPAAA